MRTLFGLTFLAATAALSGCGSSLRDDRFATGSSTVAMARDHVTAAAVNVDEGTVSFADLVTGEVVEVDVGAEPTRIARVGDAFWVTLRGERAIAVVERAEKGTWKRTAKLRAGVEPHGIVASEDGRFVYVASTQTDEVFEFDGRKQEKLRTFEVRDQPRFLALHPSGRRLYVGSTRGAGISVVDLAEGSVTYVDFPETTRNAPDGEVTLDPRTTGDLAVTPDGTQLGVPVLYADTDTSVDTPEDPEQPVVDGYGSATGVGVGRLNPALVTVPLDPDGAPAADPTALQLAASAFSGRTGGQPVFRSYATSATASPDSATWYVTMEASNVVLALPVTASAGPEPIRSGETVMVAETDTAGGGGPTMPFTDPGAAGFEVRPIAVMDAAPGPKGVVFDQEDQAVVHAWLDHELGAIPVADTRDLLAELEKDPFSSRVLTANRMVRLGGSVLPPDVEAGRRMFFSAVDSRMAGAGAGVSCSTCHFEGRNDGFTWTLQGEPRNTPSLAGPVNETAPVTWSDEVDSVLTEAQLTAGLRMGGAGLSSAEAALVDAYVNFTPYPDVRRRGEDSELVRLGREVFARADVGCASCHGGDFYTDDRAHLVPGLGRLATQTPTLRGIAASAPYFHDGSAPSLAAVVEKSRDGSMGDTSGLTDREREALVAFLESL